MASATKRNAPSGLQKTFDSILDLLIRIKPHLDDPDLPNRPSLVQDLHHVAALAEGFSEQRPRSNKAWVELADSLDQEGLSLFPFAIIRITFVGCKYELMIAISKGVSLWNISGLICKAPDDDSRTLVAARKFSEIA